MKEIDSAELHQLLRPDLWSNAACAGYLILAAEAAGLEKAQTVELLSALHDVFDTFSLEDAKKVYSRH